MSGNQDCGPAIIQRFRNADGTADGLMIESSGNGNGGVALSNVWLMGKDNTGVTANYEPITINSTNSRLTFDNVVFGEPSLGFGVLLLVLAVLV